MFSIKDITIKQGAKGEYKELQGAYNMEQDKLNMKINMFKNDPDYAIVEIGKVIDRTISQNEKGYWNFDKKEEYTGRAKEIFDGMSNTIREEGKKAGVELDEPADLSVGEANTFTFKPHTTDPNIQLLLSQQKSIWEALRRIGEHLDIEWFKGNKDIRDHYHNMLEDIPEGEPII